MSGAFGMDWRRGGLYLMFKGWLWGGGGVGEGMGTSNFFVCEELFFGKGCFA